MFAVALKGSVLLAKGEVDQALDEFERALKMQSNNLDAVVGHSAALIAKTLQQQRLGQGGQGMTHAALGHAPSAQETREFA